MALTITTTLVVFAIILPSLIEAVKPIVRVDNPNNVIETKDFTLDGKLVEKDIIRVEEPIKSVIMKKTILFIPSRDYQCGKHQQRQRDEIADRIK